MTNKALRKMHRGELLELLLIQMSENERLQAELDAANAALKNRAIVAEQAGSIAEAALRLNDVFAAADAAAAQYLENIKELGQQAETADGHWG